MKDGKLAMVAYMAVWLSALSAMTTICAADPMIQEGLQHKPALEVSQLEEKSLESGLEEISHAFKDALKVPETEETEAASHGGASSHVKSEKGLIHREMHGVKALKRSIRHKLRKKKKAEKNAFKGFLAKMKTLGKALKKKNGKKKVKSTAMKTPKESKTTKKTPVVKTPKTPKKPSVHLMTKTKTLPVSVHLKEKKMVSAQHHSLKRLNAKVAKASGDRGIPRWSKQVYSMAFKRAYKKGFHTAFREASAAWEKKGMGSDISYKGLSRAVRRMRRKLRARAAKRTPKKTAVVNGAVVQNLSGGQWKKKEKALEREEDDAEEHFHP